MTNAEINNSYLLHITFAKCPRKTRQRSVTCHNFYCKVAFFVRVGSLISKTTFHLRLFYTEIAIMTDKVSLVLQDLHGKHKTPTYTCSVVYTQRKTKGH